MIGARAVFIYTAIGLASCWLTMPVSEAQILLQPNGGTKHEGESHTFYIEAQGTGYPFSFAWYKDGNPIPLSFCEAAPTEGSDAYTIESVQDVDAGLYSCEVGIGFAPGAFNYVTSDDAVLTVVPPIVPNPALTAPQLIAFPPSFVNAKPDTGLPLPPQVEGGLALPPMMNVIVLEGDVIPPPGAPGLIVSVGGGAWPVWTTPGPADGHFIIDIPLKENAVNDLSFRVVNESGEVGPSVEYRVVEGEYFPEILTTETYAYVESIAVSVDPFDPLELELFQRQVRCTAAFDDPGGSVADITEYVVWGITNNVGIDYDDDDVIGANGIFTNLSVLNQPDIITANFDSHVSACFDSCTLDFTEIAPGGKTSGYAAGVISDRYSGAPLGTDYYGRVYAWDTEWVWLTGLAAYRRGNYGGAISPQMVIFRMLASGYLTAQSQRPVLDGPPTIYDWRLRLREEGDPYAEFISPDKSDNKAAPAQAEISAIVFDQYSELAEVELIVNGVPTPIAGDVTPEGFFRAVVPLQAGVNVISIRGEDAQHNEYETDPIVEMGPDSEPVPVNPWPFVGVLLIVGGIRLWRSRRVRG